MYISYQELFLTAYTNAWYFSSVRSTSQYWVLGASAVQRRNVKCEKQHSGISFWTKDDTCTCVIMVNRPTGSLPRFYTDSCGIFWSLDIQHILHIMKYDNQNHGTLLWPAWIFTFSPSENFNGKKLTDLWSRCPAQKTRVRLPVRPHRASHGSD